MTRRPDPRPPGHAAAVLAFRFGGGERELARASRTRRRGAKLAEIGCDLIQGSQFGRPAPAADLLDRLRDREDRDAVPAPAGLVAAQASRRASSAIHAP